MASEDALLLRNMRGASGEASVPLNVPEVEPEAVVEPEDGGSLVDLRSKYQGLSSTESRPMYRGFEVPAGMDLDRVNDWFAAIDVREDAREAREAEPYLTRTPEPWEGQFLEQMKGLSLEASKEEQRFLRDPAGRAEVYKDWAGDVYEDVMAGDPETIRNVADVSSLVDITGASDVTSAVQSGRLAYREPDKRGSHLTDAAISGTAGGIQSIATLFGAAPLVGSLLSGARLKAAMRGADVAEDVSDVAKVAPAAKLGGSGHFSDEAFEQTRKATSPAGSRETLVYMDIDEFLSLAAKGERKDSVEAVEKLIDEGTKFRNLPHLKFDESGKIFGHEGRHRAQALKERGVEKIPVVVESNDIRWQKQAEDTPDRVDFPEFLVSEDGKKKIKFPFELEGPNRGKPLPEYSADVAKAVPDAPAPVFEAAAEKLAAGLPDKLGVQGLEGMLGRKRHSKAGQVAEYTQDVKDKDTGKIIHKKGDKKLTKSGEEIVYPEYTYKDISASEWNDTKLDDFIETAKASGKKSISKDELIKHLDDNKVQIEEVRLGGTGSQEDALKIRKTDALDNVHDEAMSLATVLAPGKSVTDQVHRFSADPDHFLGLYIDYAKKVSRINIDVPDDMRDIILRISSADDSFPYTPALWKPEHAARVTEARNAVNAKLADPEYQKFVDQQHIDFSVVPASSVDPDLMKQANERLLQHRNLQEASRILNDMPEVETRLAALRKFQDSSNFQEFKQANEAYHAASSKADTMFPQWEGRTVPGGEDYQEILLTVPQKVTQDFRSWHESAQDRLLFSYDSLPKDMQKADRAKYRTETDKEAFLQSDFTGSHHSNIPNVMAHIRTKTRIDSRGRKILFVEEIQSDWHQAGLKRGYQGQKIKLPDNVESAIQKMESTQKAIDDWNKANPKPTNYRQGVLVKKRISRNRDILSPEKFNEWKKSLSKDDLNASDAALSWQRKAYGDGFEGPVWVLQRAHSDSLKQASQALNDIGFETVVSEFSLKTRGGGPGEIAQSVIPIDRIRNDVIKHHRGRLPSVPDAPLKDTKEWTALAIKRIFREAADKGYDGVAFSRADMITPVVTLPPGEAVAVMGNPEAFLKRLDDLKMRGGHHEEGAEQAEKVFKGNQYFYDKLIPSIAKKETKAKQGTTLIELEDLGFSSIRDPESRHTAEFFDTPAGSASIERLRDSGKIIEVPFFELTDKVRDKVIKPQKLYSLALPGIAVGAAAAEEEELSAAAALGAIGMGGMALYRGAKGARAAGRATDVATAGAKTEDEAVEAARLWQEMGTESPYFKKKFGNTKVLDDDGEALPVFHGTSGDFDEFRAGTPESAFGSAIYTSSSVDDVNTNYARAEGPDIRNRVDQEIDRIDSLDDFYDDDILDAAQRYMDRTESTDTELLEAIKTGNVEKLKDEFEPDLIEQIARQTVLGDEAFSVMKTYVNIENPVYLDPSGTKGRTTFDLEVEYDDDGDFVGESGSVLELLEAIDEVADDLSTYQIGGRGPYSDEVDKLKTFIGENSFDGELDALDLFKEVRGGNYYFESDTGGLENTEFIRKVFEKMGFDGIVADAYHFFGDRRGPMGVRLPAMAGVTPGTYHYMAFKPEQIKSATGNVGTFDPSGNILKGIGVGAAIPAAAAVRSQRTEEEGNPAPDEPMEEAPYEPYYTGDDYVQSYELSDSRQVYDEQIGLQSRFDELTNELGMVEAEYYSLTDAERASKRGDVLHEWYNDRLDELSSVEEQLEPDGYLRFLKGEDYYYETSPYSLDDFDARRAFDVTGSAGPKIAENIELRSAQELHQVGLFQSTVDMGGPMVHMSGRNGAMNRFVYNKAQEFNHPVQTIQLNRPDKLSLMKDIDNVQSLKDAGLISFLLYKELLGDVKLY